MREDELEAVLRSALADHAARGVPAAGPAVRRRVRDRLARERPRSRARRRPGRTLGLGLAAAAVALALATGVALAPGVVGRGIGLGPAAGWLRTFQGPLHGRDGQDRGAPDH